MMRTLAWAGLLAISCGPPPAQVGGSYTGQSNLFITGGAGEAVAEVVSVSQSGGDISFTLGLCSVKAGADGATSFRVRDFKCQKYVKSQLWELVGDDQSKVTANANNLSVALRGTGKTGQVRESFTWSFTGAR